MCQGVDRAMHNSNLGLCDTCACHIVTIKHSRGCVCVTLSMRSVVWHALPPLPGHEYHFAAATLGPEQQHCVSKCHTIVHVHAKLAWSRSMIGFD